MADPTPTADRSADRARAKARRASRQLVMMALYQQRVAGHDLPTLLQACREDPDFPRADDAYLEAALNGIVTEVADYEGRLAGLVDRPLDQVDPVERGILLLGLWELRERVDVPYRVVINEGVALAKRYGATDGHRYVNAVLDRAARELRSPEIGGPSAARADGD